MVHLKSVFCHPCFDSGSKSMIRLITVFKVSNLDSWSSLRLSRNDNESELKNIIYQQVLTSQFAEPKP